MRRKLSLVALAVAVSVVAHSAVAGTVTGAIGDGKPTIKFDVSGHVSVIPDGVPVGLFDILSDVPIFNSTVAYLPANGLFTTDNTTEKAWASLGGASAFTTNLDLGSVAITAITGSNDAGQAFLNQHLTITFSGGFGTPNVSGDVIAAGFLPEPTSAALVAFAAMIFGMQRSRKRRVTNAT